MPQAVHVSKQFLGMRKKLHLHYRCDITGGEIVVSSTEWNKWLKACATLVAAGLCTISGDVVGFAENAMESVGKALEAYDEFSSIKEDMEGDKAHDPDVLNKVQLLVRRS